MSLIYSLEKRLTRCTVFRVGDQGYHFNPTIRNKKANEVGSFALDTPPNYRTLWSAYAHLIHRYHAGWAITEEQQYDHQYDPIHSWIKIYIDNGHTSIDLHAHILGFYRVDTTDFVRVHQPPHLHPHDINLSTGETIPQDLTQNLVTEATDLVPQNPNRFIITKNNGLFTLTDTVRNTTPLSDQVRIQIYSPEIVITHAPRGHQIWALNNALNNENRLKHVTFANRIISRTGPFQYEREGQLYLLIP